MSNVIVHVPVGAPHNVVTPAGTPYSAWPGNPISVGSADATILTQWGWIFGARGNPLALEGTSANRPASPVVNDRYLDYTVGKQIFWDGANWRDPITGAAV
ncbi:hypothetical protein ACGYTQ_10280 [Burkholderia pseudomallei]|uniref:hypothetical protein n=1 Tax=Burkholderia pseudomallei TaxID=28450 RepID=UPI0005726F0F|nr:hypothetical protein [Burkholderia pseudomallei]KIX61041.1 hypothetical protein SZ31_11880 [Burkholderia pseudomallei]MBF3451132.1 hypothetical protein [Burkholderia pseudomallei]MBF3475509.1 hypothetical protein [Burkholderia pseudomallei]MBF3511194.1 hypothetical protein [Burkholderia pseudomallei]MBF3513829.1 hypothetical protein [Burkholderia pseudomallei]